MAHDADAAREHARAANGQFGTQSRPESEVELAPAATNEGQEWEPTHWDWMVTTVETTERDPEAGMLELIDVARQLGQEQVVNRYAYRSGDRAEEVKRAVAEIAAGRRGRHLLTSEPLPAATVEEVSDALACEGVDPDVDEAEAAAELARAAVDTCGQTSRSSMATHMEVQWRADPRAARYASDLACDAFGIPAHRH